MLRAARTPELALATANLEISRENPAALFVTAFAGVLDADTGVVEFCNAGHEDPVIYSPDGSCRTLASDGGPPLCVIDEFPYPLERVTLAAGALFLVGGYIAIKMAPSPAATDERPGDEATPGEQQPEETVDPRRSTVDV